MPLTRGTVEDCGRLLAGLEAEADATLDSYIAAMEDSKGFFSLMEKIEGQLEIARKRQAAKGDLDLNEAAILCDKLKEELSGASKLALGATLHETQEEWAESFEGLRCSLQRMEAHLKKAKAHGGWDGEGVVEAHSSFIAFDKEGKSCAEKLARLKKKLSLRKSAAHLRVAGARRRVELARGMINERLAALSRHRLRRKIDEAKAEISGFMARMGSGRLFVDHKHLTLTAGNRRERMPLSQAVRFSLEELAPMKKMLPKLGRSVIVGSFWQENGELHIAVGERTVVGDSVVYREVSC
jgi:hypothetical protein